MAKTTPRRVLVLFGTRPEIIKLAPVVRELQRRSSLLCSSCATGQHATMAAQSLASFGLSADLQLDAMQDAQTLGRLTGRLFQDLDALIEREAPDWLVVQGDTTSAMVAAMCGYYRRIHLAHVEAGLRTHNRWAPFPEEINRTIIGHVADLHLAPTKQAAQNLLRLGVPASSVHVTGNTAIDALLWMRDRVREAPPALPEGVEEASAGRRLVLVTCHRRESFGDGIRSICEALLQIARRQPEVVLIYPVHLNPRVRDEAYRILAGHERILLTPPLDYPQIVRLMDLSYFILTDSGGIQEEAPALGKPVLIMRETTERPEVIACGGGRLVGIETSAIVSATMDLLNDPSAYAAMAQVRYPFGDGHAAARIVDAIEAA